MKRTTDEELYVRGSATLLASWEECARGSAGAALHRLDGVAAAVFPTDPERTFYNNALLDRGLEPAERSRAIDAMAAAYAAAGIEHYAAWVHESDEPMSAALIDRGYTLNEKTRAMGMSLTDHAISPPDLDLGPSDWHEYLAFLESLGVPPGLLSSTDPKAFQLRTARQSGETVAVALAYEHGGDCGVFNVTTVEAARRQGLGSALTAVLLVDAVARGCTTASLQSTPMAEGVYAGLGFRDLGEIHEYVGAGGTRQSRSAE